MLVLSRRVDQTILVNDDIEIVILSIRGNHVHVGVRAPKSVTILRREVLERSSADQPETEGDVS